MHGRLLTHLGRVRSFGSARSSLALALVLGLLGIRVTPARVQAQTPASSHVADRATYVVLRVASQADDSSDEAESRDVMAVRERVHEQLSALGVAVVSHDDARTEASERGPALAHVEILVEAPSHVRFSVLGAHGERVERTLLLDGGRIDEATRETLATLCASNVEALRQTEHAQAVLPSEEVTPAAPLVSEAETSAAPRASDDSAAADGSEQRAPQTDEPKRDEPKRDEPKRDAPEHDDELAYDPARAPTARGEDVTDRFFIAAGYELSRWGDSRIAHGPRLHVRYGDALASSLELGVGVELAYALRGRIEDPTLDVQIEALELRALADLSWTVSSWLTPFVALGPMLELSTARALAAESGARILDRSTRVSLAFALRLGLRVHPPSLRPWFFALAPTLELHPGKTQYGVEYEDAFIATVSSSHARLGALAELGLRF